MERYVVHITKACNMACLYCYETDKSSGHYTWEPTQELLDDIVKSNQELELEFLGGEPMLNFPLIQQIVEYLEDKAKVRSYYLTTNGTILPDGLLDLLALHPEIYIGVSMDGNRFMNSMRIFPDGVNAYDTTLKNMNILRDFFKGLGPEHERRLMIHLTLTPFNVGYLSEAVDQLYQQGFRFVDIGIVEKTMLLTDEFEEIFVREHEIISENLGKYPGLTVTSLAFPTPPGGRTYVRDAQGKVIAESYGRVTDDFTSQGKYTVAQSQEAQGVQLRLKQRVYEDHQRRTAQRMRRRIQGGD